MTIEQTLAEVSKHLQELELPGILTVVPPGDARIPEAARECQHGNDPAQCEECTPHEADEPVININGRDLTEDQADTAIRQIAERAARDGQEG